MNDTDSNIRKKEDLCRMSGCPLAGSPSPMCRRCTGPVSWTDSRGKRRGVGGATHRSCTSCPMNGLGLPVCWAACDGPNPEFQTDGQSMVTLGGMPDASSYLGRRMAVAEKGCESRMFNAMETALAAAILRMDAQKWTAFSDACDRHDARDAAKAAGVPLAAFRGHGGKWEGSPAQRIMAAMGGMTPQQLEIVRGLANGLTQKRIADLSSGISKQAVHTRLGRLKMERPWIAGIARIEEEK